MSIWDSMERDFGENVENRIKILRGLKDEDDLFKDFNCPSPEYKKIILRSLYSASDWWSRFIKGSMTRDFPYCTNEKNIMCTAALYGLSEKLYLRHFFNNDTSVIKNVEIRDTVILQGYYGLTRYAAKTFEQYKDDKNEDYNDIIKFINIESRIPRIKHTEATSAYPLNAGTILQLYQNDMDVIQNHIREFYVAIHVCLGDKDNPYYEVYKHMIDDILDTFANATIEKFDNFKDKMRPSKELLQGFRLEQKLITLNTIGMIRRIPQIINDREFFKKVYMK